MNTESRCTAIELILADVDGVLTDGSVVFDNQGIEIKRFHIRDGMGIKLWQRAGYTFGIVSARSSHIVKLRAAELGVDLVRQGTEDKLATCQEIMRRLDLSAPQVCYVGDDLPDLAVLKHVGFGVAVADAATEVGSAAHYVTKMAGGRGAVRETIELILKSKNRWKDLIRKYE